jgi:aspartyl/asparaginyl beta-hydroxylase (cupin superfamily)
MKLHSLSTLNLLKKIASPDRALLFPPVFNSDEYEALSVQLETFPLNGVYTIDLITFLSDAVLKLSDDVTHLKSDRSPEAVCRQTWKLLT